MPSKPPIPKVEEQKVASSITYSRRSIAEIATSTSLTIARVRDVIEAKTKLHVEVNLSLKINHDKAGKWERYGEVVLHPGDKIEFLPGKRFIKWSEDPSEILDGTYNLAAIREEYERRNAKPTTPARPAVIARHLARAGADATPAPDLKRSLLERYEQEWADLSRRPVPSGPKCPTNPLLLDVPDRYFEADCRVMVFGQEPGDWEKTFPHPGGVNHLLEIYRKFYNVGDCYTRGYRFFDELKALRAALEERFRPSGQTVHVLWNDLVKIGKAQEIGVPPAAILRWEDRWFDVARFEVDLLQPDVVVFFSGSSRYVRFIRRIFPGASFESVNHRPETELAWVRADGLPPNSVRCPHPGRKRYGLFDEYVEEIVAAIRL